MLVKSVSDGQLGTVVETTEGRRMVRLDRGKNVEMVVPYTPSQWEPAERPRLSPIQVAHVCYEADKALRRARGEYGLAEWATMKEPEKISWLNPPKDEQRAVLYAAIKESLR